MSGVHEYVGYFVVGVFAIGWIWGLAAKLLRRGPGDRFWTWLTVAQVTAATQAIIGIALLVIGRRLDWLHYAYGLFPIGALVIAHGIARGLERDQWVPFAWASFFSFGLTLRALMTGLGIG